MKRNPPISLCPLCLESKVLVVSHIIPRFYWKRIKESGNYHVVSASTHEKDRKAHFDYQEHLLCKMCDNERLKENEDELARLRFNENYEIIDFNYAKTKNGILSVLWRMHLSEQWIYRNIKLKDEVAERIREIIYNKEETNVQEFPVLILAPLYKEQHITDIIIDPHCIEIYGNVAYRMLLQGFYFSVVIGTNPLPKDDSFRLLSPQGVWRGYGRDIEKDSVFTDFVKRKKLLNNDS